MGKGVFRVLRREILIPGSGIDKVMQHLSRATRPVTGRGEGFRQEFRLRQHLAHLLAVFIKTGPMRRNTGEDGRARRVAGRGRTVGIGK